MGALKKIKGSKAAGMDDIVVKMFKNGGISIIAWLLRIFDKYMVPVYRGKSVRRDCVNYRGISILSIPGKIYGSVLINRVIESTKKQVEKEGRGLRAQQSCTRRLCNNIVGERREKELTQKEGRSLWAQPELDQAFV